MNVDIGRIVGEINKKGYGTLSDVISQDDIQALQAIAEHAVEVAGGESVHYLDFDDLKGTILNRLFYSDTFKSLCQDLYKSLTAKPVAPEVNFYVLYRCLKGASSLTHSNIFHYDSYVLTVLIPVAMPKEGPSGDLLIVPQFRHIRRFYLMNLVDKVLLDNKLTQRLLKNASFRKRVGFTSIRLKPGNMYFFTGYQSIHTSEICNIDQLRATALFHYEDPHKNSKVKAVVKRLTRLRLS